MQKDPRNYLDTYFGTRNNIKGNPVEGVNYTLETLTYMTSHNRADQVTQLIINKLKEQKKVVPFGIFECCAGIGGNTMSFLENPAVQWVVSYELRPDRREMLKRNLAMYNLAAGGRAFVPEEAFGGVPPQYKDVVLYFDPPWLPETIKGHESTKDQYVLHGIKIGDKTLEQWIASCPQCSMIVMRVPPGYQLDPIPGFKIESQLLKNSLVIFAVPERVPVQPTPNVPAQPIQVQVQIVQPTQAPIVQVKDVKSPIRPVQTEFVPNQAIKDQKDDGNRVRDYNTWYNGLRNYLRETLKIIVPSPELRERMVSDEAMKIWVNCFTHETYDPNVGRNFEELEFVGDHAMEYNFVIYLYKTIPNITRSELSEIKSSYISKPFQAKVALSLGLQNWVRIGIRKDTHTFEDLLESFFGGINMVGDTVFKFGAGTGLCYNMIVYIFKDIEINMNLAMGKPKTQIKEMFEKLHWGKAIENFEKSGRFTTASISFTPEAMQTLSQVGINLRTPVFATATGTSKKVASDNVYEQALNAIIQMGITNEWVQKMSGNKDLSNPELTPYIQPVQAKLSREGYASFYLKKVKATDEGKYIQLIGVKPDNTLVILATSDGPKDETEGKIEVLTKYLQ